MNDYSTELADMHLWPTPEEEEAAGITPATPAEAITDPIERGIRSGHATEWPDSADSPGGSPTPAGSAADVAGLPSVADTADAAKNLKDTIASLGVWGAVAAGVLVGGAAVLIIGRVMR